EKLCECEREVVGYVVHGFPNRVIADRRAISARTGSQPSGPACASKSSRAIAFFRSRWRSQPPQLFARLLERLVFLGTAEAQHRRSLRTSASADCTGVNDENVVNWWTFLNSTDNWPGATT